MGGRCMWRTSREQDTEKTGKENVRRQESRRGGKRMTDWRGVLKGTDDSSSISRTRKKVYGSPAQ